MDMSRDQRIYLREGLVAFEDADERREQGGAHVFQKRIERGDPAVDHLTTRGRPHEIRK